MLFPYPNYSGAVHSASVDTNVDPTAASTDVDSVANSDKELNSGGADVGIVDNGLGEIVDSDLSIIFRQHPTTIDTLATEGIQNLLSGIKSNGNNGKQPSNSFSDKHHTGLASVLLDGGMDIDTIRRVLLEDPRASVDASNTFGKADARASLACCFIDWGMSKGFVGGQERAGVVLVFRAGIASRTRVQFAFAWCNPERISRPHSDFNNNETTTHQYRQV